MARSIMLFNVWFRIIFLFLAIALVNKLRPKAQLIYQWKRYMYKRYTTIPTMVSMILFIIICISSFIFFYIISISKGATIDSRHPFLFFDFYCRIAVYLLSLDNSLWRTYSCTRTAVDAQLGVNRIFLAFWNCALRALVDASTACNAVVCNYVSHSCKFKICIIVAKILLFVDSSLYYSVFNIFLQLSLCGINIFNL